MSRGATIKSPTRFGKINRKRKISSRSFGSKKKQDNKELGNERQKFVLRADIEVDGKVRCPSFTVPLMDFNDDKEDSSEDKK